MKARVCFVAAVLCVATLIGLSGCPTTGPKLNSFTLHNNLGVSIVFLSVNRTGDVSKDYINLLQDPIPHGGTFDVDDLVDGKYGIRLKKEGQTNYSDYSQTFEGGKHYDWYLNPSKSGGIDVLYDVAPTAKTIVDAILAPTP